SWQAFRSGRGTARSKVTAGALAIRSRRQVVRGGFHVVRPRSEVMLTFPNVTPAAFALVLTQLREEGSKIEKIGSFIGRLATNVSDDTETQYWRITGHHWPLGDIRANVAYDGGTVTVDVVQPKAWEQTIGERIGKSIEAA